MAEVITLKLPIIKGELETLLAGHYKKVKCDRYWDSHGKKIYTDHWPQLEFKDVDVKIECQHQTCYGKPYDVWTMYINGKKEMEIEGYKSLYHGSLLKVDAPTGHG